MDLYMFQVLLYHPQEALHKRHFVYFVRVVVVLVGKPAQFHPNADADTILRKLEPLPKLYAYLLRWAKRKPETCKGEVNR
jgi:hypothetical protein